MQGELHCHSRYSDGSLCVQKLPILAARAGLSWLAVSDHDSLHSVRFAYQNPVCNGVQMIPATELTAFDYKRRRRVHILCYFPNQNSTALQQHCAIMAQRRNTLNGQRAKKLEQLYPQFKIEDAYEIAQGGVLFKATLMQALFQHGLADGIYKETYKMLFQKRKSSLSHQPQYQSVQQVLQTIRQAQGVAVLAHPSVYASMELARQLAQQGEIDGLEVHHPRNTAADRQELLALARVHNLIVTGGTDFHGINTGQPHPLGLCTTGQAQIERIQALAKQRKGTQ